MRRHRSISPIGTRKKFLRGRGSARDGAHSTKGFVLYFSYRYVFKFWRELLDYCANDCTVLRMCAEKFRKESIAETGIDPFNGSFTIASFCNKVFRSKFYESETLALISPHGYHGSDNQSHAALQWLYWREQKVDGVRIQHARSGGEVAIGVRRLKVDGASLTDSGQWIVYQFHGCLWSVFRYREGASVHLFIGCLGMDAQSAIRRRPRIRFGKFQWSQFTVRLCEILRTCARSQT